MPSGGGGEGGGGEGARGGSRRSSSVTAEDQLGALPEGWEERLHSDGRIFFIDHSEFRYIYIYIYTVFYSYTSTL